MARAWKTTRDEVKMVSRWAEMLPPHAVFIPHHQRETRNEWDPGGLACNLHVSVEGRTHPSSV